MHEKEITLAETKGILRRRAGVLKKGISPPFLPFKSASLDYVLSDHFLFANYHKGIIISPGFELEEGSIQRSEEILPEINRILKIGGHLIINHTYPEKTPDLRKYRKGFKIAGFEVTEVFYPHEKIHGGLEETKFEAPISIVLKKIENIH